MKKLITLLLTAVTFFGCLKDEPEVDPALEFMPIQLTSFNMDYAPSLSPDKKNIVFLSMWFTYNPYVAAVDFELFAMNRYGEQLKRLIKREEIDEGFEIRDFWWSGNSDYVTVLLTNRSSNNRKSGLVKVSLSGEKTVLHLFDFLMENLSYSPDGKKTAFMIQEPVSPNGNPSYSLYSANLGFTDTVLIDKGLIGGYDWAKDSKMLIYSLYDWPNENYDLWKIQADATGKTRFTETPEDEYNFRCSKTENSIIYSSNNKVYISATDKFAPRLVIENASAPIWIPNRKLFVFSSEQSAGDTIWTESWIADLDGNIIRKIAEGEPSSVSFSNTGDYYVYAASGNIWMDYLPK